MKFRFNPTLFGFMKKEFSQALRDPKMRTMLFVAPIIQMILFGVALTSDVKNVRLSFQPRPGDTVLQHVYERALASGWFIPAKKNILSPHAETDPFEMIQSGEADAVLVPPPGGLTQSIGRGEGEVQLLINASNVLRAQSVEAYMRAIMDEVVSNDYNQKRQNPPIYFDMRILFNPTMRTAVFMVPGVMSMLICLITVLLTSMSISREKETGTFEMLVSAPVKIWEVMLGKTLPYVVLGMSNIPLILIVAVYVFGVPMRGSILVLMVAAFFFVCTTVSVGTLISVVTRTQQQSMMGGFLFIFPAIQLSGLMFPLENMPPAMKVLAYLNPLTYFMEMLRNIMLKGGEPSVLFSRLLILILMAITLTTFSYRKFRTTLS
jgi:ABC-2 type transport system permease protein